MLLQVERVFMHAKQIFKRAGGEEGGGLMAD